MSYKRELLTEGEEIVREFHPHWRVLIAPIVWTILGIAGVVAAWTLTDTTAVGWLVTAIVLIASVPFVGLPLLRWRFTQYVLTNERLIVRTGVIARGGVEIPLENINDIRYSQNVIERLLGYGDVTLESAGEHGQSVLHDIADPEAFQSQVYRAREDRKLAFGGGAAPRDAVAQLEALAQLHRDGVLTDEEFAAKKARLLEQI